MESDAVFAASAVHRRAVADLLEGLSEPQLATASLCRGWDVRTVGAHLAAALTPSKRPFVLAMLRHAGNVDLANDALARQVARRPISDVVGMLRDQADSRFAPPVVGPRGPLTDVLVHLGDMRLPLGLPHDPPGDHVRMALDFISTGRPLGFIPRGRLAGLRLEATDLQWQYGQGPAISGKGIDLVMAACGRSSVLSRLDGPGVDVLRPRLQR